MGAELGQQQNSLPPETELNHPVEHKEIFTVCFYICKILWDL